MIDFVKDLILISDFLYIKELSDIQNENKSKILNAINIFKTNNTDVNDILVIGSSCMVYMDYAYCNCVKDVDIFCNKYRGEVIITNEIDLMPPSGIFLPSDYLSRVIEKDGVKFLSKEDLIVNMISTFTKQKYSNRIYLEVLLQGMDLEYIYELFDNASKFFLEKHNDENFIRKFNATTEFFRTYNSKYLEKIKEMQHTMFNSLQKNKSIMTR